METKNETQPPKRRKIKHQSKKQDEWHFCNEQGTRRRYVTMKRPKGQQKNSLHVCFGPVGLQPFLVFYVFCLLQKHCFSPENGLFCSFLSVSLSFSLVLSLFLFHSLSLSISFLVFFVFFLAFLLIFSFLVFLLFFFALFLCVCFTTKFYIWKVFFHQLFLFGGGFLFCFVFQNPFLNFVFSFFQLCVLVNINVFIFQRRPFLKHPVLFCALCKVIIFVKGRFWGQIWLMFEKHCKNEHFSTGLRTWWSKLVRFSGVEGFRVTVIMWARWEKVWGCRPQSRTSKTKISHVGVFSVLILFFGHWCRTMEVINLKRWVTPPPPPPHRKKRKNQKGKQKEHVKQQGQIPHL